MGLQPLPQSMGCETWLSGPLPLLVRGCNPLHRCEDNMLL